MLGISPTVALLTSHRTHRQLAQCLHGEPVCPIAHLRAGRVSVAAIRPASASARSTAATIPCTARSALEQSPAQAGLRCLCPPAAAQRLGRGCRSVRAALQEAGAKLPSTGLLCGMPAASMIGPPNDHTTPLTHLEPLAANSLTCSSFRPGTKQLPGSCKSGGHATDACPDQS